MHDILDFWFGVPASSSAVLQAKIVRWFRSGPQLDPIIRERFGHLVNDAFAGQLDTWAERPSSRLALILLLDQFTRHVFRGTPRMYAGDPTARWLALDGLERGHDWKLGFEERMFFVLPLAHSERLDDQEQSVAYARKLSSEAPAAVREAFNASLVQPLKYRETIARFGRFPHRNAVLGRPSTPDELAFLQSQAAAA